MDFLSQQKFAEIEFYGAFYLWETCKRNLELIFDPVRFTCHKCDISIKVKDQHYIFYACRTSSWQKKVCHALKDIIFLEKQIQNHRAMPVI